MLAEVLHLRFTQSIRVQGGHFENFLYVLLLFAHCDTLFPMALRECRVTFRDVRDIDHSVVVHAETTMDAAALGLKR
jgi:hypothetical protein